MENINSLIVVILIIGMLIPVGLGVFSIRNDAFSDSCIALTTSNDYHTEAIYNQPIGTDGGLVFADVRELDFIMFGIKDASLVGKNITSMQFYMFRTANITDLSSIQIGIWNDNQTADNPASQIFRTFQGTIVSLEPTWSLITANFSSGYVLQSDDIMGIRVIGDFGNDESVFQGLHVAAVAIIIMLVYVYYKNKKGEL